MRNSTSLTPAVSRFLQLAATAVISSVLTTSLIIAYPNDLPSSISSPVSHSPCTCSGDDPSLQVGSDTSARNTPSAQATPASQSRFLIDPYPVLGPVRWEHLSAATQKDFTLNGRIRVASWFVGDAYPDTSRPIWTTQGINEMVSYAKAGRAPKDQRLSTYGQVTDEMFFKALQEFPVQGKSVLVVGSKNPWVEAFCINAGAAITTTVDFNVPIVDDPRVKALSIAELDASDEKYDAVFSYSSLEHDGLGRYGDPINPWGDIERMRKMQGLTKPSGRLYLGVPTGSDAVHFNAHRIYGRVRFPMLTKGWRVLKTFGQYSLEQHYGMAPLAYLQPLVVLELDPVVGSGA